MCVLETSSLMSTKKSPLLNGKLRTKSWIPELKNLGINGNVNSTDATSAATSTSTDPPSDIHPTLQFQALKIVVLGSACSGKSSVIKQFVGNGQEFTEIYDPTGKKRSAFKTILTFDSNNHQITHWQLKIVEIPVTDVPASALVSWSNFIQFDIGNAAAYLIVFDVSAQLHSFEFVRMVREQLINHPLTEHALIFVIGNKVDLPYQLSRCDILNIVEKQWKLPFLETSAKKNYHVQELFQAVIEAVQAKQTAEKEQSIERFRHSFKASKCLIQ